MDGHAHNILNYSFSLLLLTCVKFKRSKGGNNKPNEFFKLHIS